MVTGNAGCACSASRCIACVMPSRKNASAFSLPPWRYGRRDQFLSLRHGERGEEIWEDSAQAIGAARRRRSPTGRRSRCCRSREDQSKTTDLRVARTSACGVRLRGRPDWHGRTDRSSTSDTNVDGAVRIATRAERMDSPPQNPRPSESLDVRTVPRHALHLASPQTRAMYSIDRLADSERQIDRDRLAHRR